MMFRLKCRRVVRSSSSSLFFPVLFFRVSGGVWEPTTVLEEWAAAIHLPGEGLGTGVRQDAGEKQAVASSSPYSPTFLGSR